MFTVNINAGLQQATIKLRAQVCLVLSHT